MVYTQVSSARLTTITEYSLRPSGCTCSLLEHCRKHKYLSVPGEVFAWLVSSLLENLLDYRTIMHDESKENRMSCTVNVLVRGSDTGAALPTWLLWVLKDFQ